MDAIRGIKKYLKGLKKVLKCKIANKSNNYLYCLTYYACVNLLKIKLCLNKNKLSLCCLII